MPGQVVQITINVTDGNASEAVQQIVAQLHELGPAGEKAGAEAGAGLDEVKESALSARENVRLLSEELGMHVPRAMQSVIASNQLLMAGIGAIGPAMIAIGGADILFHLGEMVYKGYENFVLLKGAIGDSETVIKSFGDAAESAMQRAYNETEKYLRMTRGAAAGDIYKLNELQNHPIGISQYQSKEWQELPETMKADFEKITGQSVMPKDLPETIAKLQTYQGTLADILDKSRQFQSAGGFTLGNSPSSFGLPPGIDPSERGIEQQQQEVNEGAALIKNLLAQQAAYNSQVKDDRAQLVLDAKEKNDEIRRLEIEARNSQLSDVALLEAKREEAIAAFESKFGSSMRAIAAIDQTFLAQETALWDKQWEENEKQPSIFKPDDATLQKGIDQAVDYDEKIRALSAQSTQIEARDYDELEARKEKLLKDFLDADKGQYQDLGQALAAYVAQSKKVEEDAGNARTQIHQKVMNQIAKEEEQAARFSLAPWEQALLKVQDEWEDKVRVIEAGEAQKLAKLKEGSADYEAVQDEANRKELAAYQEMSAQKLQIEEETRNKLASGLQSLFSNPAQFFEKRAMDSAFQYLANQILPSFEHGPMSGVLQYMFGMGPEMNLSRNTGSAFGSALGGGAGTAGMAGPSMLVSAGSTLNTAGAALLTSAQALTGAASALSMAGGGAGSFDLGVGGGASGVGGLGGGAGSMPDFSTGSGMAGSSPMPETQGVQLPGTLNADGTFTSTAANTGGVFGKALNSITGGLAGAMGVYSAFGNSNPLAGAVAGAEGGAALGSFFGPVGTAIGGIFGAIGGALAGVFGDKGLGRARDYDKNTVQPTIGRDLQDYEAGRSGYNTAYNDLNTLMISARSSIAPIGSGARGYFSSNIQPEIAAAMLTLQRTEIGGRGNIGFGAAQFHSGGAIGGFGSLATSEDEGFIHAMRGEMVLNRAAAAAHAPILHAMNAGVQFSGNVQPRMPAGSSGGSVTLHFHALDSKSVAQWARGGGRDLVAALNQAQRQYSGVGRG
jgi:hypothetical protein